MNKKKLAIVSLSVAMVTAAFTGLSACKPKEPDTPIGGDEPTPVSITKPDTRTNAYTAYTASGSKVGEYKTIADAINATVTEDADSGEIGGYVTKTGGTTKLFVNREGYSSEMDDMFWYYTDGNKLESMMDWETDSISYLQNNKVITHEISSRGTKSVQSWNGYGLLDENGNLISADKVSAQSWELSSTMDAALIQLTSRLKGVSGMDYEIDLSNVKITPPYDGADATYAFLGFYSWQDYYVIVTGIACNTRTGDWYAFDATSRDDSFSDASYNIGQKLLTSTWNEQGGYFKPDCDSLSMSIRTTVQEDDEGEYQVNKLSVKFGNGKEYTRDIDESTVNEFFSGAKIGWENAYAFVAGLDIVNEVVSGVKTKNTDYFNGSTFENLTIKSATVHVPDEEELSSVRLGLVKGTDPGDYDILLASTGTKPERGIVYDYTILNTYACTTYAAASGKDVYSFRYDGDPVASEDYGPTSSVYQNAINALSAVTQENALDYEDAITAVGAWYGLDDAGTGTTLPRRYWNVLNFTQYLAAKELLASSVAISDEALAVLDELNALGNILNYKCLGWQTDGDETVGYLYTEVEKFRAIKAKYDQLSADDQAAIFYRYEKEAFETWQQLSEDLQKVMASAAFTNGENVFHAYESPNSKTPKDYDNESALGYLFYLAVKTSRTDDPWKTGVENDDEDGSGSALMNFDNNTYPSVWICRAVDYFKSIGVTLPAYLQNKLEEIEFEDFYYGAYYPIYHTVALAQRIGSGDITSPTDITEEELAFLNEVWVSGYDISSQISWNWISGDKFEKFYSVRTAYVAFVAGGSLTTEDGTAYKTYQYFDVVANYLESLGYEIKGNGWGVTADKIELTANDSEEAKAVAAKINALSDVENYTLKGWSTEGDDIGGYLYNEALNYKALAEEYNALSGAEKIYVGLNVDIKKYNAWATVAAQVDALLDVLADVSFETYSGNTYNQYHTAADVIGDQAKETLTGERVVAKFMYYLGVVVNSGVSAYSDDEFINTAIMQTYLDCLNSVNDLKLPDVVANQLAHLNGYQEFYNDYYLPIYTTVQLANRILDGTVKSLFDLTEEDLAVLNQYWVSGYNLGAANWHWNSGNHFADYHASRTAYIVRVAGGTVTTVPEGSSAKGVTDYYFTVLGNFLVDSGYTLNENGWGVTVDEIKAVVLDSACLAVLDEWKKLGAFASASSYIGWESVATDEQEAVINGYLKNEVEHFTNVILVKYNALTSDEQAAFCEYVGEDNFNGWKTLSAELTAIMATEAFKNFSVSAPNASNSTAIETYSAGDAIRQMLYFAIRIGNADRWTDENDDGNGAGINYFASDNNWLPAFRILFFRSKLVDAGIAVPEAVTNAINAVAYNSNAENFMADFDYLYNVLSLAAKIQSGEVTALNAEVAEVVNTYMVNFEGFAESGLAWNFTTNATGDFLYRSKAYKLYFGLDMNKTLAEYVKLITDLVVAEGYELTASGLGVTTTVTAK